MHSIVVVKYKHSTISGRLPTRRNEENYIILLVREAHTSYLRMNSHRVGEHLKKICLNKNSLDLLLISFVFYIRNSLEKRAENSGVLLTAMDDRYFHSAFIYVSFNMPFSIVLCHFCFKIFQF